MAKPRIFVSSTYYDLKHIRSSLENFIDSLGYEPILSENGAIAYTPDQPLDESCYREVRFADIFVLIIGGRYGSLTSEERSTPPQKKGKERLQNLIFLNDMKVLPKRNTKTLWIRTFHATY